VRPAVGALVALAALTAALALPDVAGAHAYLVRTVPEASRTLNTRPTQVALTYSEAIEPRFAIVSVTDAAGEQVTAGAPHRSPADVNTLLIPLAQVPQGWYLVYWRVISVDGHPVRGAFTFAVGPNPGPPPEFVIPSISETVATPELVAARTVAFLAVMIAIGLFVLRIAIARPLVRRVEGTSLRSVTIAFGVAAAVSVVAVPVYLVLATSRFALRSAFALGDLMPLIRDSAFGRGFLDLAICFVLFVLAAGVAIWVDRPERPRRSIAELLATGGAFAAAAAVLVVPGLAGHAAQLAPRGLSLALDWLHLTAGSIWLGGLLGLLVLWRALPADKRSAGLAVCVPRFSNVALGSVLVLVGSGIWVTVDRMPTLGALWQTSYGQTVLVKIALLAGALLLAAGNLLRARPRLESGPPATTLLRRLTSGETVLIAGAVLAAALLSSLAPPARALSKEGSALARVGPGRVDKTVLKEGYLLQLLVSPNRAAGMNAFALRISKDGKPVRDANVKLTFTMLDMEMGEQAYRLRETRPGVYAHENPALVMVGVWGLDFDITPRGGTPFEAFIVDRAR
jgi:copper transport protein